MPSRLETQTSRFHGWRLAPVGCFLLPLLLATSTLVSALTPAATAGSVQAPPSSLQPFHRVTTRAGILTAEVPCAPRAIEWSPAEGLRVLDAVLGGTPLGDRAFVPRASAWLAVPPGSRPEVTIEVLESEPVAWPAAMPMEERERLLDLLPSLPGVVGSSTWFHDAYGVPLTISPLFAGEERDLFYARSVSIRARIGRASLPERIATGRDPFEPIYRSLFLNYDDGRAWRRAPLPSDRRGGDSFASTDQPWIKLQVTREDVYQVLGSALEDLGIDLANFDPLSARLFASKNRPLIESETWQQAPAWMEECAIAVEDGGDGSFDRSDRILFYGVGPDAWYSARGLPDTELERYLRDPYAPSNIYWLTSGGSFTGEPRRWATATGDPSEPYFTSAIDRIHIEDDGDEGFFDPRPRTVSVSGGAAVPFWERFFWRRFRGEPNNNVSNLTLTLPDPIVSQPVRLRIRLWGQNDPASRLREPPPDHDVEVRLNGEVVKRQQWGPLDGFRHRDIDEAGTWLVDGAQRFVFFQTIWRDTTVARVDRVALAWMEFDYTRQLVARNDTLSFFAGGYSAPTSFQVSGFGASDPLVVDATDPFTPAPLVAVIARPGGEPFLHFQVDASGETPHRVLLRAGSRLSAPAALEVDRRPAGGYLRERTGPAQMLIVTHREFEAQAEELAAERRAHFPGRTSADVAVVDVQDIYDEFSFGRVDPTALRNFFQCARGRWNQGDPDDGPAYVALLGDAHYDFRDILGAGARNWVPTYEGYFDRGLQSSPYSPQFASDDFYALLDGVGDGALDLITGRFPVQTETQATVMVDKAIGYKNSTLEPWRNRVTLVADDRCQGLATDALHFIHTTQTEALSREALPTTLYRDRVYLLEYGDECAYDKKPAAAEALRTSMNEGTLIVNYTGHGSEVQLADERVFEVSSVSGLRNADRLFFFLTASCSVGKYDHSGEGLGEALVRHGNGGAIAVFSASAVASSYSNAELNQAFFRCAFPNADATLSLPLGLAAVCAKTLLGSIDLNRLRYILMGDPTLRLASPGNRIRLSLSAEDGSDLGNTLPRGALVRVLGEVENAAGEVDTEWEGEAPIDVYDSEALRHFEVVSSGVLRTVDYEMVGAPIFRGVADVTAGRLALAFRTPTALRTGPRGQALAFAYSDFGGRDAGGGLDDLLVPEDPPAPSSDRVGPEITLRISGDPENLPLGATFTATFFDSSGVNITGLVPSRSVILRIEADGVLHRVVDLAAAVRFEADYRRATLESTIPGDLEAGHPYELVLEASDNANNRASAETRFSLTGATSAGFALEDVYNFPNPTDGATRFLGQLSAPAEIEVRILTPSGRLIARVGPEAQSAERFADSGLEWDGRDADGDRLGNGVYFYKVSARPLTGGKALVRIGRLVVSR